MSAAHPELSAALAESLDRCRLLVEDLSDAQWRGPRLEIVNPPRWELGHVAWFLEWWFLRQALGEAPLRADADALYDSIAIAHDLRWDLPLPDRAGTLAYYEAVRERSLARLERALPEDARYHAHYGALHADMHAEAFAYTRQTLGYPPPREGPRGPTPSGARGDAEVRGGELRLGAEPDGGFCFDNEKWAHPVRVRPFRIARRCVTEGELAAFADAGGYGERACWDDAGWAWRQAAAAEAPLYWRRGDGGWELRRFDAWRPLQPELPAVHVCWHEARAWCRWAGRRLPSEAEWVAARDQGAIEPERAAWEWTTDTFGPFPGFTPDPYREYSEPWFGTRKVLRGAAWASSPRYARPGTRNFYEPERRDVFAGFRTCAS